MAHVTDSVAASKLACPKCDNQDARSMLLFSETIETDRYSFDRMVEGIPVFAFGKSVETEPGPVPPSIQCSVCGAWWTPPMGTYEIR
jgi:hypothetical protein